MIIGFTWGGWLTGGTAEKMANDRADAAVVKTLTPFCVQNFLGQPKVQKKMEELLKTDTWQRRELVEQGGWATPPGSKEPIPGVGDACAAELTKAKK